MNGGKIAAASALLLLASACVCTDGGCPVESNETRFGPLNPGAEVAEVEYIWAEGKMPDSQPQQIAAKTHVARAPGFKREANRRPFIEWFVPKAENRKDVCIITVSGGGFDGCCDIHRLKPMIDRYVELGVTVANLTYRTPRPQGLPIYQSAWEDMQRTIRVVRSEAAKRGYSSDKIGATGISAGANAVLRAAMASETRAYPATDAVDEVSAKLNFAIPLCPAYVLSDGETSPNARAGDGVDTKLLPVFNGDAQTPPMCFFQGGADPYSTLGSTRIYRKLREKKIPAELHIYPDRGHDFTGNLNRQDSPAGCDRWFDRAVEFLTQLGFFGKPAAERHIDERWGKDVVATRHERQSLWPEGKMPDVQTNQCTPYLEWYVPEQLTTKAIQIIYSGGSYMNNGPDGFEVAPARRYLNSKGMAVVTMRYRTPRPLTGLAKHTTAWQDLQRAIRLVKAGAASRGLDPNRIGIMGSSAGGHLTLMGATTSKTPAYWPIDEFDKLPCNVQWAVAIYPAYALTDGLERGNATGGNADSARLAPEFAFDLATCPILFIHGDADGWAAMNSVKCWEQLRRMGIQGELHTLALRGHCFQKLSSVGTGSYSWLDRIWEFMNGKGYNK